MKQRLENKPLITVTAGIIEVIHKQSVEKLADLKIPKTGIKTLMKNLHHNTIKYLTYVILNKRKLDNNTIAPP